MPRPKTGGRQKGTPNKRTAELQREIAETGLTPLEVMVRRMRWHSKEADLAIRRRDYSEAERHMKEAEEAAGRAAPYLHAKLASLDVGNKPGETLTVVIEGKAALF